MVTDEKSLNLSPLHKPDTGEETNQGNNYLLKLTLPNNKGEMKHGIPKRITIHRN